MSECNISSLSKCDVMLKQFVTLKPEKYHVSFKYILFTKYSVWSIQYFVNQYLHDIGIMQIDIDID